MLKVKRIFLYIVNKYSLNMVIYGMVLNEVIIEMHTNEYIELHI